MNGWWNIIVLRDWYDDTVDALTLSTCVGLTQVNEEKTWASWLSFIVTTSANDIDVEKNCSCSALLLRNVALTYCVKGNFCFDFRTFNTCYAYFFKFYSVFNHYQDVNSSSQFICLILGLSLKLSSCQAERTSSSPQAFSSSPRSSFELPVAIGPAVHCGADQYQLVHVFLQHQWMYR